MDFRVIRNRWRMSLAKLHHATKPMVAYSNSLQTPSLSTPEISPVEKERAGKMEHCTAWHRICGSGHPQTVPTRVT